MRRLITMLAVLVLVAAACGDGDGADPALPEPALSGDEIEVLEARAQRREARSEAWPDVERFTAGYAEDVTFSDPTWSDVRTGREALVRMQTSWEQMTDFEVDVTASYVSVDGAALEQRWPGLQPPLDELPADPPVTSGLEVYRFRDGEVASVDLWYRAEDDEVFDIGCFAGDGCEAMEQLVDDYVTAWSERDADAVADLYHDDAVFSDGLLGLAADGDDAIGDLVDERFGPTGEVTIEVLDRYAWTHGRQQPNDLLPDRGRLIGVALHHRVGVEGAAGTHEAIATLELCERDGRTIEPDPDGLIHRERIYHRTGSLGSAPPADGTSAAESWDVLYLSNRSLDAALAPAELYALRVAAELDVAVDVVDWTTRPWSAADHVDALRDGYPPPVGLVRDAEVIVLYADPTGYHARGERVDACGLFHTPWTDDPEWPPALDYPEDWDAYRDTLDDLYAEVWRVREGRPVVLRALDVAPSARPAWERAGIAADCQAVLESLNGTLRDAAEEGGATFVSFHDALYGPDDRIDPVERGWIDDRMGWLTTSGAGVLVGALLDAGLEANTPPG